MANIKISGLPDADSLTDGDFLPMVDTETVQTQKVTLESILSYITSSNFDTLSVTSLSATTIEADTITAREYHTELITASVIYESGSTKFGNSADDLHEFTGSVNVTGDCFVTGSLIVTETITELSTRKVKDNITSLDSQLERICRLNPVSYNKKDTGRKEYGFISEEIKQVYPEFVNGEGVIYSKMVSILVSAVKDLKKQVENQENEIKMLKNKIQL